MIEKLIRFKFIILLFIIFEIIIIVLIYSYRTNEINKFIKYKTHLSNLEYEAVYSKLKEQSIMIFDGKIDRPKVIELFGRAYDANMTQKAVIREELYQHLQKYYHKLSSLINLRQLHFHLPDNRSFLRMHRPDKFGDDLSDIRPTVAYVNRYHKSIDGFEEGRVYYGFRFVYPLFDGNRYIGSVEISFPTEAFKTRFNYNYYTSQFIIAKKIVFKKVWERERLADYSRTMISSKFCIENIDVNSNLKKYITQKMRDDFDKNLQSQREFSLVNIVADTTLIFSFLPMKNPVTDELVGYMIIIYDDNTINTIILKATIGQILGFILVFSFFVFVYRRKVDREILIKSESKYRTLIENIGHSYFFYRHNRDGVFTYTSDSLKKVLGYSKEEFRVRYDKYLTNNILNKEMIKFTKLTIEGVVQPSFRVEVYHKNGSKVWLEMTETPQYDKNGNVESVDGIAKEVTSEIRLDKIINNSQTVIFYWFAKENWPVAYVSKNIDIFGYSSDDFLSNRVKFSDIIYPDDLEQVYKDVEYYTQKHIDHFVQIYRIFDGDGNIRWIDDRTTIERNLDGDVIFYLGTIIDITQQKETQERLLYQTKHDELTNLPNRTLLKERIRDSIQTKNRFAIIYLDFDRFKEINDSMGHSFGDKIIVQTADRFDSVIDKMDTVARLGGDEFAILVNGVENNSDIINIIDKIVDVMKVPFIIKDQQVYITVSIGISLYPEDGNDVGILLKNADAAMFKAKDDGRGIYRFYAEEMTKKALEHIIMETNLRQGLNRDEFIVYYQPQVDSTTGRLIGVEALVRWQHPTMGLVAPFRFIPLAEKTGLIIPLDRWVMRVAMGQIVEWYRRGLNPGILALNLSIQQLQKPDFISMLSSVMRELGMRPEWLELEITESHIMTNPKKAIKVLSELSKQGIKLAIDDFGTGYSSLSYLKQLPIDKLKIDRSFIKDIPTDKDDIAITKSIISLSKTLNLDVIAEGVESVEQKEFLIKNGCSSIQGYLYGKPMESKDIEHGWLG
jgi:diguanylate cyclase (GGDEF)-like protein/PAS domain S-box-containing protein